MSKAAFFGADGTADINQVMLNFYRTWVLPVPGTDMNFDCDINSFQSEFVHIWLLSRGQSVLGTIDGDTRKFLILFQGLSDTGQTLDQLWASVGAFVGPLVGP